jgi:ribonuclease HII
VLLDGVLSIDKWIGQQETIIEGDNKYIAIAAASILAKVTHDQWIGDYCTAHPECNERYDLVRSNGYGTAKHREGIKTYGGHELHRSLYIQHWLPGSTHVPKAKSTKKGEPCLIRFSQV